MNTWVISGDGSDKPYWNMWEWPSRILTKHLQSVCLCIKWPLTYRNISKTICLAGKGKTCKKFRVWLCLCVMDRRKDKRLNYWKQASKQAKEWEANLLVAALARDLRLRGGSWSQGRRPGSRVEPKLWKEKWEGMREKNVTTVGIWDTWQECPLCPWVMITEGNYQC